MNIEKPNDNEILTGWYLRGVYIPPLTAYTRRVYWMDSFIAQFPDAATRMRDYDRRNGVTPEAFYRRWFPVVIHWLNKNCL